MSSKTVERVDHVVIRFAGDSGDGMQLTGDRFTAQSAAQGNDLATLPNYPAEIRAPQGTIAGVSSFQVQFADHDVNTPGDAPDVLVAMNPAALAASVSDLPRGAIVIADSDEFTPRNLTKAGYTGDPLDDGSLDSYQVYAFPMTSLTVEALSSFALTKKEAVRAKNMFALGVVSWLYSTPTEPTESFIRTKFGRKPEIMNANLAALEAGWSYGETAEIFAVSYEVAPAATPAGTYRNITGNMATAYGLLAGAHRTGLPLVLGSYPITPASDILHHLSELKRFGVKTLQVEDEIAGITTAIGASYGGAMGVTTTSGPGLALKTEAMGLAVMLELPLVIVNVQRGGPSTGLPTKTEQADLLQALYGRNGEAPIPVLAARSPNDCFDAAVEAIRIATTYRTPVLLLTDGYLANGSEPWRIPDLDSLPDMPVEFASGPNAVDADGKPVFRPYLRDPETLARPWAIPGVPGLAHRIGGLEKADVTGMVSYDPDNHDRMIRLRQAKVERIPVPDLEVDDPTGTAETLVIGWGSTYGPISTGAQEARRDGVEVAHAHLRHLNPLPANAGDVLRRYRRVLVPEMNLGQLTVLLRSRYLVDAVGFNRVRGLPFTSTEIAEAITKFAQEGTL
ncbi:MAG: 2-oxoacid:acceptor oxidoreductase subunit alpha [Actinomycetales bacterium]|nr:2-oxoacid:acceptor oxidoreductase subunit alpha [Actinomycetales bacterium]